MDRTRTRTLWLGLGLVLLGGLLAWVTGRPAAPLAGPPTGGRPADADRGGGIPLAGRGAPAPEPDPYFEADDGEDDEETPGGGADADPVDHGEDVLVRVLDGQGRPVPAGRFVVSAARRPAAARGRPRAWAGPDRYEGRFRAGRAYVPRGMLRGRIRLTFVPEGTRSIGRVLEDLDAAGLPAEVRLPDGALLRGRIVTPEGEPAPFAQVQVLPASPDAAFLPGPRVQYDERGAFHVCVPRGVTVRLRATSGRLDRPSVEVEVAPGAPPPVLVLPPETSLLVHVQTPDGSPAPGARIEVNLAADPRRRGWGTPRRTSVTTPEGWIRLTRLPPDVPLRLRLRGPTPRLPYAPPPPTTVFARAGEVRLRFETGEVLRGRVLGPDDLPLGGVRIQARTRLDGPPVEAESGADGRFALGGLSTGTIQLSVDGSPDHGRAFQPVTLPAERVVVRLERVFSLRLPIQAARGAGTWALAGFEACWTARGERRTARLRGGAVALRGLHDRPGWLHVGRPGDPRYALRRIESPRRPGPPLLLREGGVIRGRIPGSAPWVVRGPDGDRWAIRKTTGRLHVVAAGFELVQHVRAGPFATPALPPGEYTLELRRLGDDTVLARAERVAPGAGDVVLDGR